MVEAGNIAFGCDVAILVRPFVHIECIDIAAVDPETVDDLRNGLIDGRTWIRHDHDQFPVLLVGFLHPQDHIRNPDRGHVRNNPDLEIGIGMFFHVFSFYIADMLQDFFVPERDPGSRFKTEIFLIHVKSSSNIVSDDVLIP